MSTRQKSLARFRDGQRIAQIAREAAVTPEAVGYHVRRAGDDPAARRRAAESAERERFARAWNAAAGLDALAAAEGSTPDRVQGRARYLRAKGYALKRMPHCRPPIATAAAVAIGRLLRRSICPAEIARQVGVSRQYVHQVIRGLSAWPGRG
jgi:hypothetical protein